MNDLFAMASASSANREAPLAYRMRPRSLDEIYGQPELTNKEGILAKAIRADRLMSVILHGPPGTGKTSIAHVIAKSTRSSFTELNAVSSGVQDIRRIVEEAKENRELYQKRTLVFIDEIHRFNRSQQDALLPHVESGLLVLVGATTENPAFAVNAALLSRSLLFQLRPLAEKDMEHLIDQALKDEERGLGSLGIRMDKKAQSILIRLAHGDARRALNTLEMAAVSAHMDEDGFATIRESDILSVMQAPVVLYDRAGDEHYDTISAFIKSVRGSDVDAAMVWLAKMIVAGEDPLFIARRLIILAVEDIGDGDPSALTVAVSGLHALEAIGMPEGRIVLAQVTAHLAKAPKSNRAYRAIQAAIADVKAGIPLAVPTHLRGTSYAGAKRLGRGEGYLYPHDYPGHYVEQNYWPEGMSKKTYYPE
ncbi:replication-associated recombination protein A [Alicyclobacillus tolerans]|uniref:replication-associated recombination protein A n=1 Tax=Alicyclobacillus tolerans TaxID=90970 RepID=UPI003B788B27